jgi:hypothetical protein
MSISSAIEFDYNQEAFITQFRSSYKDSLLIVQVIENHMSLNNL